MFSHVSLGTNDFPAALKFYDTGLSVLGLTRVATLPDYPAAGWGTAPGVQPQLWVGRAWNDQPATPGNGAMVAFLAEDRATVDAVHAAALAAGGTDEGAPGPRPFYHPDYYGAYFRDLDGNKLHVVCRKPP